MDGLDDELEVLEAELVETQKAGLAPRAGVLAKRNELALGAISEQIFAKHLDIVDAVADFAEVDSTMRGPSDEWIEMYGLEGAKKRFRVAQAAWMSAADAPVALKIAPSVVNSMIKAKATEKGAKPQMLVALVHMPAPTIARAVEDEPYEIIEVEGE